MQIDYCLILAAGFGTRMGAIGQKLPKVLWPVFEKSLLELQVAYARSLGAKKIFINLHYMGEEIERHCKSKSAFQDVEFLWEKPEILDIGGAIHNLAQLKSINYHGRLLVLNADQFFYIRPEEFQALLAPVKNESVVLLTYTVNSSDGYNSLVIDGSGKVKSIQKNQDIPRDSHIPTYTGISLIDLTKLNKVPGVSKFFDSVCSLTGGVGRAVHLEKIDYWDFGTVRRYWDSMFRILETYRTHSVHPFLRFLVGQGAIKSWKINLQGMSYHAKSPRVINLSAEKIDQELNPSIILNETKWEKRTSPTIWWGGIDEEIS
jgi:mannose-1-phosphate guanylyltransferase